MDNTIYDLNIPNDNITKDDTRIDISIRQRQSLDTSIRIKIDPEVPSEEIIQLLKGVVAMEQEILNKRDHKNSTLTSKK